MTWLLNGLRLLGLSFLDGALQFFSDLFKKLSKKLPGIVAMTSLIVAATVSYLTLANGLLDGIHKTVPTIVLDVWGWVMPYNAVPCLIAIISARLYRWAYQNYKEHIETKAKILLEG